MLSCKRFSEIFVVIVLSLLAFSTSLVPVSAPGFYRTSSLSSRGASSDPSGSFTLNPGWSESIPISLLSGMNATFRVSSSSILDVYFMDSAQFSNFESTGVAQALYHSQGSYVEANIGPFTNGTYYLVIDNDISSQQVNVNYTLSILPVDIYEVHSSLPSAVGITDYGVLNASGVLKPYRVLYDEAIGTAEIYSMKAYNSSPPSGIPAYGASLQQNVVLQVNTTTGDYVYWLQNVVGFITDTQTMNVWDNIWNYTSYPSYLYSENITGNGRIQQSSGGLYYAYGATSKPYSLPLDISLYISVERYQNSVRVNFGYTIGSSSVNWYDSVTIYQSGITGASLVISGYRNTPKGMFYDSELVFGGYGNGEHTDFTQMDAELFMKYILDNGSYASPIQLYGFGSDTAEAADDLTTLLVNGTPTVKIGSGNFEPLSYSVSASAFSVSLYLSVPAVDAGMKVPVKVTSSVSNGLAPYTYFFYINGKEVYNFTTFSSQFSGTVYLPPLVPGNYSLQATVYDARGDFANSSLYSLTVNRDPKVSLVSSANVTDVGLPLNVSMFAYMGTPPYSYYLYVNNELVHSGRSYSSFLGYRVLVPYSAGSLSLKLVVNDSSGYSLAYIYIVKVNQDPSIKISLQRGVYDAGQSINLSESISYGTPPYRITLYINGTPYNSSSLKPLGPGTYIIYASLNDAAGYSVRSNSISLKVNPDPVISYSYTAGSNSIWVLNSFITVSATVQNGTPPYTFVWYLNGQEVSSTSSSNYTYDLASMGLNIINVSVTDSAGYTVSASFVVDYTYNYSLIVVIAIFIIVIPLVAAVILRKFRKGDDRQKSGDNSKSLFRKKF